MNRYITYIVISLLLIGCSEQYEESLGLYPTLTPRYLTVTPTSFTYASSAGTRLVKVTSTQTPWKMENGIGWVTLSPTSGSASGTISVGVSENTAGDEARTGIFYLKADVNDWKYEAPISVTQAGATPYINLSKSDFDFTGAENRGKVTVSANCTWEMSTSNSWIAANKSGNSIEISIPSNETNSYRTGTISIVHTGTKNASAKITVRQAPSSITASTESLTFNNTAGSVNVTINSEASWTASSASSWIEVSPTSDKAGTSIMKVSVSPNTSTSDRTGYVILSIGSDQRIQIPVRQKGIYIEIDKTLLTFEAAGQSQEVTVSSNTSWVVLDCPSWISVSNTSGNGDATITITASNNASTSPRSAKIKVTQEGVTVGNTIILEQKGKSFDVSAQALTFEDIASSKSIDITAEDNWQILNSNPWISVSSMSGSGNSSIIISVEENPVESSRQGTIDITMLDKTISVTIIQRAKVFNADTDSKSLTFPAAGGSSTLNVTSNTSWTLSDYPSWITLSATSGNGNATVKVTATENTSADQRTSQMYLTIDGKTTKTAISLTQYGKSINVSPTSLAFTSSSSTQNVTVTSDGEWEASTSDSWITLSPSSATGNGTLKVNVTENMSVNTRSGSITISMGGKDTTIGVTQGSKSFGLTPSSLTFTDKSGSQTVAIETDGTWNATSNASWISVNPTSASGNSTLLINVTENISSSERTGSVSVTMGDKTLNISVSQRGKYLTIANSLLEYTSKGGTIGITVTTNDTWTAYAENGTSWITLSQTSGSGTADIKVVAADNASVNSRTAFIVVETTHGQNVRVMVTQSARYLTVDHSSLLFYSKGGTSEAITVSTDGTYSISCSDSWLSVNQSSNTFTVTATKNTTTDARIGYITIALTDLREGTYSLKLTVTQLNYGGSFLCKDYGDDINYDNMGNSTGSLTITGFGSDKNYDSTTTSGTTLSVSNFKSDSNWDTNVSSKVTVTITGYNSDTNLDSSTNTSGSISKTGFEGDANWQ